jgi:glucosamine-6-phosphate deaminase
MITASAMQLHPDTIVYVDAEAGSEFKMHDYYEWVYKKKPGAPQL